MAVLLSLHGCAEEHTLAGKPASYYFADNSVAELARAGAEGDVDLMDRLVARGADVNYQGFEGITPLLWVLPSRNKEGLKKLLELGADPNQKSRREVSPMWMAAGADDPEFLKILLSHGGDPNIRGYGGRPALFVAAEEREMDNITLLLRAGADINAHTEFGDNVAMICAGLGYFDLVYFFLENGLTHDLEVVARDVDIRRIYEGSDQYQWKQRVVDLLKRKGMTFPTAPLNPQQ